MRKLLSFIVLTLITATSAFAAINDPTFKNAVRKSNVGSAQGENVREVRLVRFGTEQASTASIASGDAVIWDTLSDDGVTIARTTTSADGAFAGIAACTIVSDDRATTATEDTGLNNWGWIIVSGVAHAKISAAGSNGAAVGDLFITSTDSGAIATVVDRASVVDMLRPEARRVIAGNGGFFLDSPAVGDTSVEVYVKAE